MDKVFIVAEAGVNHNGSLEMAKELVDAAKLSGADAVKFQTFQAELVASKSAPKAKYQSRTTGSSESQLDMIRMLELSQAQHFELVSHCAERGIEFMSTPFDLNSLRFLDSSLNVRRIKISSGDLTNVMLLVKAGLTGKQVLLSTGMSTLAEVEIALGALAFGYLGNTDKASLNAFHDSFCSELGWHHLKRRVSLLHCTTEYPAPYGEVNLRAMDTLGAAFALPIGLSDHTEGISVAVAAVARGATVIEKHLTLDQNLPGPDHKASCEPSTFKLLVDGIRQVEQALGHPQKIPAQSERKNIAIARRSLVASCPIKRGQIFTEANITSLRPATGLPATMYWDLIGTAAGKDFAAYEQISFPDPR